MAVVLPPVASCSTSTMTTQQTRKRTSSFSYTTRPSFDTIPDPRPIKAARLSKGLRRTSSFLDMDEPSTERKKSKYTAPTLPAPPMSPPPIPPRPYKSRTRSIKKSLGGIDPATALVRKPAALILSSPTRSIRPSPLIPPEAQSNSSPYVPIMQVPRCKAKAKIDLHRKAVTTCMLRSPEGQRFLHMGPRLAWSIASATKELEKIVASAYFLDVSSQDDLVMTDVALASAAVSSSTSIGTSSSSWVVVPGDTPPSCDWEMISCN